MNHAWSYALLKACWDQGVRDVVVSPGSRSTPLVAALLDFDFNATPVQDERQAGFFALGCSRAHGRPTALICTSGTAMAHYLPAFIEAKHTKIQLVALTADRPKTLQNTYAPQTTDQEHLLASTCTNVLKLPGASDSKESLTQTYLDVRSSLDPQQNVSRGPVHINIPFEKPLYDRLDPIELIGLKDHFDSLSADQEHSTDCKTITPSPSDLHLAKEQIENAKNILITIGPFVHDLKDSTHAIQLAKTLGAFVYSDITANIQFGPEDKAFVLDGLDHVARTSFSAPDLVLQIGSPVVSSSVTTWTEQSKRIVICTEDSPDPTKAGLILKGDPKALLSKWAATFNKQPTSEWGQTLHALCKRAWSISQQHLSEESKVICDIIRQSIDIKNLVLSNSLPVRVSDVFLSRTEKMPRVFSQRGVSGIDGLISGAIGIAQASKQKTLLLIGDVAFNHDVGALALVKKLQPLLDIVVLDNSGGRIFGHLPLATSKLPIEHFEEFWTMHSPVDWKHIGLAFGVDTQVTHASHFSVQHHLPATTAPRLTVVKVKPNGALNLWKKVAQQLAQKPNES